MTIQKRKRIRKGFALTSEQRSHAYNIATAGLVIIAAWLGFDAVTHENWQNLIAAILNISAAGVTNMAKRNVT